MPIFENRIVLCDDKSYLDTRKIMWGHTVSGVGTNFMAPNFPARASWVGCDAECPRRADDSRPGLTCVFSRGWANLQRARNGAPFFA